MRKQDQFKFKPQNTQSGEHFNHRKQVRLFGIDLDSLYPNPLGSHGKTIQSRVNCDSPDLETFPKFSQAKCQYCVLEPGEMLFIPAFVWHQVLPASDHM